jgi:soluble lytic murein transglycosylase
MKTSTDPKQIILWFKNKTPITAKGGTLLGAALLKQSSSKEAIKVFRETWVGKNFSPQQERRFYKLYRRFLTRQDHIDRLERLLWMGRYYPVRRMLPKVNKDYRALAFARITLRRYRGSVDRAIAKVPKKFLNNPGLIYERVRWRRRKGRDIDAIKLLKTLPQAYEHREYWWKEKSILLRRILRIGRVSEAYNIARSHGLTKGPGFAQGEWLSGWIALRFLHDGNLAIKHFENLYKNTNYPISRARGAYWTGRAAEYLKNSKKAFYWYTKAMSYPLTFYGQLASIKINPDHNFSLQPAQFISKSEIDQYGSHELVRVVNILGKIRAFEQIRPFMIKLLQQQTSTSWLTYLVKLAHENNRPDLAIYIAKMAYRSNTGIIREGYPILEISNHQHIEPALVHAIIRQESAFNTKAISRAGARGLMQIMPATAQLIAKRYKLPYRRKKLTQDMDYNINIGQKYLSGLLKKYDGSYLLSLSAYNAGSSRIKNWIIREGDPRSKNIDTIDWIEKIPFTETRNYVQRVIENINIYRLLFNKPKTYPNKKVNLRYWEIGH